MEGYGCDRSWGTECSVERRVEGWGEKKHTAYKCTFGSPAKSASSCIYEPRSNSGGRKGFVFVFDKAQNSPSGLWLLSPRLACITSLCTHANADANLTVASRRIICPLVTQTTVLEPRLASSCLAQSHLTTVCSSSCESTLCRTFWLAFMGTTRWRLSHNVVKPKVRSIHTTDRILLWDVSRNCLDRGDEAQLCNGSYLSIYRRWWFEA